ncbi:MAG: 2-oxo acid dehydrogenase subunit E2 [Opitutaceae bacterium]|nr:2-oxo acid dehydrogenase subunit E2 [Opitutaceae bacterium]
MIHPVRIPHEQVNDQSVLLVEWMAADGAEVKAGQPIAVIETSKSTAEIEAPAAGFLRHGAVVNTELPVAAVFCHITASPTDPLPSGAPAPRAAEPAPQVAAAQPAGAPAAAGETTFSKKALDLITQHGLAKELFTGKGLVREADVQAVIAQSSGRAPATPAPAAPVSAASEAPRRAAPETAAPGPIAATGVPVRIEELPRLKRVEIKYLASGSAFTLASVVTVPCPVAGLRAAVEQSPALGGNATAIIVYEAARLLKKYPIFNAYYAHGRVHYYEQVNVGVAVDGGKGLKVPVIAQADTKGLVDIAREMQDRLLDYVNDELPLAALAGGTFTITDLSSEGVVSFHPLINQGQAAILGIGADYATAEPTGRACNLILAFDHQLTEGRTAARFLCELRDRVATYAGAGR